MKIWVGVRWGCVSPISDHLPTKTWQFEPGLTLFSPRSLFLSGPFPRPVLSINSFVDNWSSNIAWAWTRSPSTYTTPAPLSHHHNAPQTHHNEHGDDDDTHSSCSQFAPLLLSPYP